MVTFFRESQVPCRPPRAVKPHPRKRKPKYDLPVPSIHSEDSKTDIYVANWDILKIKCGSLAHLLKRVHQFGVM